MMDHGTESDIWYTQHTLTIMILLSGIPHQDICMTATPRVHHDRINGMASEIEDDTRDGVKINLHLCYGTVRQQDDFMIITRTTALHQK